MGGHEEEEGVELRIKRATPLPVTSRSVGKKGELKKIKDLVGFHYDGELVEVKKYNKDNLVSMKLWGKTTDIVEVKQKK